MHKQTTRAPRWLVAAALVVSLAACANGSATEEDAGRAVVTPIEGTELSSVQVSSDAAERIGIVLATVERGDEPQSQIPYSAVLYDPEGSAWVFVDRGDLTFAREPISVDRIEGEVAYLTEGPPVGTGVVAVGATELYGAEIGVGDE